MNVVNVVNVRGDVEKVELANGNATNMVKAAEGLLSWCKAAGSLQTAFTTVVAYCSNAFVCA